MKNIILIVMVLIGSMQFAEAREYRVSMPDGTYALCKTNMYAKDLAGFVQDGRMVKVRQYYRTGWCHVVDERAEAKVKKKRLYKKKKAERWEAEFRAKEAVSKERDRIEKERRFYNAVSALGNDSYQCSQDLTCWAERNMSKAVSACKHAIEKHAKNNYKWVGKVFTRYGWKKNNAGVLMYLGNSVEFVNSYGAWSKYKYICEYNTITGSHGVSLEKGVM